MSCNPATRANRIEKAERAVVRGLFHGLAREVRREEGKPWRLLTPKGAVSWWPWNRTWSEPDRVHGVHKGDPKDLAAWLRRLLHGDAPREAPEPQAHRGYTPPRRLPPLIRPAKPPEDDFDVVDMEDRF